jgi:hypothetical protein
MHETITDNNRVIFSTQQWLHDIVIGHNFCPFAQAPLSQDKVRFSLCEQKKNAALLETLVDECRFLDEHDSTDTSLLILSRACGDFNAYLDLVDMANALLAELGYEGVYQIASFHPQYCFDGVEIDDVSNYTNRSPYPMLHLLREDRLEAALEYVDEPELIPERNIAHCQRLGSDYFKAYFKTLE